MFHMPVPSHLVSGTEPAHCATVDVVSLVPSTSLPHALQTCTQPLSVCVALANNTPSLEAPQLLWVLALHLERD